MKKLSVAVLTLAASIVFTSVRAHSPEPAYVPEDCACVSPDGSCSASVTCRGGCTTHCMNNGDCFAECSGYYADLKMKTTLQVKDGRHLQLNPLRHTGKVQISGQDFEKLKRLRQTLLSGERISLCVRNTPVSTFVNDMASVTGLPLRIISGRPKAPVNVTLHSVTLSDILARVSAQTGTVIVNEATPTSEAGR